MIKIIRSWKWVGIIGSLLFFLYLVTRLTNLTALPIFTDEAIYIRWSQIGANDANWRFISMTDGKQPLFTWMMMPLLRVFPDPLVAGRMVSVLSGIGTMVGIGFLSYELFRSKRIVLLSVLLYVISPFSLMYDRLALYDSLSAALAIWNLYLAVLLVRYIRLDIALLFGLMLGAGMLNKTSGFIAIYLLPFMLLLFNWKDKHWKKNLLRWIFFAGVAFFLSQLVYGILRLSPLYHMIAQKDFVFVHPFKNWYLLYRFFLGNLRGLTDWLTGYLTWPICILALTGLFIALYKLRKSPTTFLNVSILFIYCFVPLLGLAYFGKVLYPRFILFMAIPLLLSGAYAFSYVLDMLGKRWWTVLFIFAALFISIRADYFIVTNPTFAPIPFSDRGQLMDDWPSGYGVREVVSFLRNEAKKGKIAIFTEGTFGLFPYAIEIYLGSNPNVSIKGVWPLTYESLFPIARMAGVKPTYLITNQTQEIPPSWPLVKIVEYQKGTNKDIKLRLFRVTPPFAYKI